MGVYNPYGDPSKNQDAFALKTNYLTSDSPFENAKDDIKKLQEEIYNSKNLPSAYKDVTPLDKMRMGYNLAMDEKTDYMNPYQLVKDLQPTENEAKSVL